MSSTNINDLLQRITELLEALTALVDSDTARALPGVAEELGATELLHAGIDALVLVLGSLHQALADLEQNALVQLDAIGGLLGLLEPAVGALGRMIGGAGSELADHGLDQEVEVTEPVARGLAYAEEALRIGSGLTVDSERFAALLNALVTVEASVAALAATVALATTTARTGEVVA